MTIHLPKDLEGPVLSLVRGGRYASVDEAMAVAARLLLRQTEGPPRPMSEQQLQRHMLDAGLLSRVPDIASDFDDPADTPITVAGESVSETIIRERR